MGAHEADGRLRGVHGGTGALGTQAYLSQQVLEARILTQPTPATYRGPHEKQRTVPRLNTVIQVVKRLIEFPEASMNEGQLKAHVRPAPIRVPLTKLIQALPSIIDVPRNAIRKPQR